LLDVRGDLERRDVRFDADCTDVAAMDVAAAAGEREQLARLGAFEVSPRDFEAHGRLGEGALFVGMISPVVGPRARIALRGV
jgi:hypothetical protein